MFVREHRCTYCSGMADPSTQPSTGPADGVEIARRLVTTVAVLAVVGTIIALVLVQRIGTRYRDGLEVARDGADVAAVSAEAASSLAADVSGLALAASDGLDQTHRIVELASASIEDVGTAMGSNLAEGVAGTSSVADRMAGFIEGIENLIPGDSESLAEDLRELADGLEPVPDQLRSLGAQLLEASSELDASKGTLDVVKVQLSALNDSIVEARTALAAVENSADDLAVRAKKALDGAGTDLWLTRVMVVIIGAGVAAACLAARRALVALGGAGGGTRTHTPFGTGS